ncbi:MAG: CBS domain-containing protein [Kiloniellales bacterium]|nr:CBS domain-containing protein [Kiloniellales bacterium]
MHRKIVPDIVSGQKIELLAEDITVRKAAEYMAERHIGAVMLGKSGKLAGIFTERDLLTRIVAAGKDPEKTKVGEVMTKDPDTVGPDEEALTALEKMREKGYRHLPVAAEDKVVGIVSIRDLYAAVKNELESDLKQREAFIFDTGYGSG